MGTFLVEVPGAALEWNKFYVLQAGVSDDGEITVKLRNMEGGENWCFVDRPVDKTILAVALTALTSNMPVRAYVDFENSLESRVIFGLYLVAE
jgi:hypothetical protein